MKKLIYRNFTYWSKLSPEHFQKEFLRSIIQEKEIKLINQDFFIQEIDIDKNKAGFINIFKTEKIDFNAFHLFIEYTSKNEIPHDFEKNYFQQFMIICQITFNQFSIIKSHSKIIFQKNNKHENFKKEDSLSIKEKEINGLLLKLGYNSNYKTLTLISISFLKFLIKLKNIDEKLITSLHVKMRANFFFFIYHNFENFSYGQKAEIFFLLKEMEYLNMKWHFLFLKKLEKDFFHLNKNELYMVIHSFDHINLAHLKKLDMIQQVGLVEQVNNKKIFNAIFIKLLSCFFDTIDNSKNSRPFLKNFANKEDKTREYIENTINNKISEQEFDNLKLKENKNYIFNENVNNLMKNLKMDYVLGNNIKCIKVETNSNFDKIEFIKVLYTIDKLNLKLSLELLEKISNIITDNFDLFNHINTYSNLLVFISKIEKSSVNRINAFEKLDDLLLKFEEYFVKEKNLIKNWNLLGKIMMGFSKAFFFPKDFSEYFEKSFFTIFLQNKGNFTSIMEENLLNKMTGIIKNNLTKIETLKLKKKEHKNYEINQEINKLFLETNILEKKRESILRTYYKKNFKLREIGLILESVSKFRSFLNKKDFLDNLLQVFNICFEEYVNDSLLLNNYFEIYKVNELIVIMRNLCIIFEEEQVFHYISFFTDQIILNYTKIIKLSSYEISMLYMIYLSFDKKKSSLNTIFFENLTQNFLNRNKTIHQVSILHLEIVDYLTKLGIKFLVEKTFLGLDVDILLLDENDKNIGVLEIHGYQHYLRNFEVITGDTFFKKKIIKNKIPFYFEIEIFNWELLNDNDKPKFLLDLLKDMTLYLEKTKMQKEPKFELFDKLQKSFN